MPNLIATHPPTSCKMKPKKLLKRLSPFGKQKNSFWKDHHRCYEGLNKTPHDVSSFEIKPVPAEIDTDLESSVCSQQAHDFHQFTPEELERTSYAKDAAFPVGCRLSPPPQDSPPCSPSTTRCRPLNDFANSPLDASFIVWEDSSDCGDGVQSSSPTGVVTWPPSQDNVSETPEVESSATWGSGFGSESKVDEATCSDLPSFKKSLVGPEADSDCTSALPFTPDAIESPPAIPELEPLTDEDSVFTETTMSPAAFNTRAMLTEPHHFAPPAIKQREEKRVKISVLLLKPANKSFELTQVQFRPSASSVEDVLSLSKERASDIRLVLQKYSGLYHPDREVEVFDETVWQIQDHDILVAIPVGYSSRQVSVIAKSILSRRSMTDLVHRLCPEKSSPPPQKQIEAKVTTALATVPEREKKIKLLVLLLDPRFRTFELCEIKYRPSTASIKKVLGKIPGKATRPELGYRTYVGLCKPADGAEITKSCLSKGDLDVVVAVPKRFTGETISCYARQVLSSRSLSDVVEQHKLDQDALVGEKQVCSPPQVDEKSPGSPRLVNGVPLIKSTPMGSSPSSSEVESLPSVACSAMSTTSSSDMSCGTSSTERQIVVSTPPPPPLMVSPKKLYSAPSVPRRTRRAKCKSFAMRVSGVIFASMVFVYRVNSTITTGGVGSQSAMGASGFIQAIIMIAFMVLVQRSMVANQAQKRSVVQPKVTGIPETVLVAVSR